MKGGGYNSVYVMHFRSIIWFPIRLHHFPRKLNWALGIQYNMTQQQFKKKTRLLYWAWIMKRFPFLFFDIVIIIIIIIIIIFNTLYVTHFYLRPGARRPLWPFHFCWISFRRSRNFSFLNYPASCAWTNNNLTKSNWMGNYVFGNDPEVVSDWP